MAIENLTFAKLELPRYISPETDPLVLDALLMYDRIALNGLYQAKHSSLRSRLFLTMYDHFLEPQRELHIGKLEDEVVAVASLDPHDRLKGTAWVDAIAVREDMRRRQIGRKMVRYLSHVAKENRLETLRLQALPEREKFYTLLGFTRDKHMSDPTGPFMELVL